MKEVNEPAITINGWPLTQVQAMTVRVAIGSFAISLAEGLGNDEHGKAMTKGYMACVTDITRMMRNPRES